jgi:ribulose kinase
MKCTIGIDYGTQSARAILVNIETGEVLEHAVAARSWHSCSMSRHKCCYRYIIDSCFIDRFL